MSRAGDRRVPMRRLILALVTTLGLIGAAAPAEATLTGFIILIQNGLSFPIQGTDPNGLSIGARSTTPVYLVQDGTKGPQIGTGTVVVWAESVSDPFFAPFGPIAALMLLDLGNGVLGLLSLIQTPTEWLTTIAVTTNGQPQFGFSGGWVFGPGTLVSGGTAADLVIGGVLAAGPPTPLTGVIVLDMQPRFYVPGDPTPTGVPHCLDGFCTTATGSFYGQTIVNGVTRPIRAYSARIPGLYAHLGVFEAADNVFTVVACTDLPFVSENVSGCSTSVPGSAVAGGAYYQVQTISTLLSLDYWAIAP